jgi:multiple sugar transport system substrate-binding protein
MNGRRHKGRKTMDKRLFVATLAAGLAAAAVPSAAQTPFADVGKHPEISILINSSPWFGGFEKVVDLYEKQTGNKIKLDVTPYGGMLEKARNAVRAATSPYDILNLDALWTIEFYEGGFLKPLNEIDANFALPAEVLTFEDSNYWNAQRRWRTRDGGKLMGYSPNGNIHVLYYRADLLKEAGLEPPKTWDDVGAICQKLHRPPGMYGFVTRGEKGNPIRYDWTPFMQGAGASIVRNPQDGDYTVTINSPQAKQALDRFIALQKSCAPPNVGVIGQGDVIQLLATGRAAQGLAVIAAWPTFDDRQKSAVVGKINTAVVPAFPGRNPGVAIGNWVFTTPNNTSAERQRATIAFSRWFLTAGAQRAYAEGGGIPVRSDTFASDLASRPEFRWMKAYLDSQPFARQELGYAEGAQVEAALGLRLNQALIGEMSSGRALNTVAREIEEIFRRNGRRTGQLDLLPE